MGVTYITLNSYISHLKDDIIEEDVWSARKIKSYLSNITVHTE